MEMRLALSLARLTSGTHYPISAIHGFAKSRSSVIGTNRPFVAAAANFESWRNADSRSRVSASGV